MKRNATINIGPHLRMDNFQTVDRTIDAGRPTDNYSTLNLRHHRITSNSFSPVRPDLTTFNFTQEMPDIDTLNQQKLSREIQALEKRWLEKMQAERQKHRDKERELKASIANL